MKNQKINKNQKIYQQLGHNLIEIPTNNKYHSKNKVGYTNRWNHKISKTQKQKNKTRIEIQKINKNLQKSNQKKIIKIPTKIKRNKTTNWLS